jgi:hypothetical protein
MPEKKQSDDQSIKKVCDFPPDSESKELKVVANNPLYECMKCGRSAISLENLCRPAGIASAW